MQFAMKAFSGFCLIAAFAVFASSCYGPPPFVPIETPIRDFHIDSNLDTGTAPFTWVYEIVATPGKADLPRSGKSLISKIEMDFGEGTGLVDVTDDVHDLWQGANLALVHEYATAGEYAVMCRVTYYDGSVALWINDNDIVVQD